MKKFLAVAALATFMASCSGSKWSCKKRYCKTDVKPTVENTVTVKP